jgi:beta-glucosidase
VIGEFFVVHMLITRLINFRWGTYSTTGAANAGLDLEMPGATKWRGEMLLQAVGINKVPSHVLDERVRNVLNLVNRCAAANIPEYAEEKTADTPETAALLRKIGGDSIVLMKNEGNILPLKKDKKVSNFAPEFVRHQLISMFRH